MTENHKTCVDKIKSVFKTNIYIFNVFGEKNEATRSMIVNQLIIFLDRRLINSVLDLKNELFTRVKGCSLTGWFRYNPMQVSQVLKFQGKIFID